MDTSPTLFATESTLPSWGASSVVSLTPRRALSAVTCALSTFARACAICSGVCGCRLACWLSCADLTLLSADVTCASAESIAFWSLSRVFFWFCFAVVMACWSACSVEVRVFRALVSAFFSVAAVVAARAGVGVGRGRRPRHARHHRLRRSTTPSSGRSAGSAPRC